MDALILRDLMGHLIGDNKNSRLTTIKIPVMTGSP